MSELLEVLSHFGDKDLERDAFANCCTKEWEMEGVDCELCVCVCACVHVCEGGYVCVCEGGYV